MNRRASGAEAHLKVVNRPSLYTTDTPQNAADKKVSILASLESDSSTKKISRGAAFLILMTVFLLGFSYWAYANSLFKRPLLIPGWIEAALNISETPRPAVLQITQPAIVNAERPAATPIEESRTAIIVTEPVPPLSTDSVQPKQEIAENLAKLNGEPAKKKNSDEQPVSAVMADDKKISQQKSESSDTKPHKKVSDPINNSKTAEATHKTKQAKTEAVKSGKDEDVELIAALLSRVSRQDASGKEVKPKANKAKTASTSAKSNGGNQSGAKRLNPVDPNRDVVARTPDDTTDDLLKRCKALGFFEGQLCRLRICSTLWGIDPACPAPEQTALPNAN